MCIRDSAEVQGKSVEYIKQVIADLHEFNPMMGHRGCRLSVTYPEIAAMQSRAIIKAAIAVKARHADWNIVPEIMIDVYKRQGQVREIYHDGYAAKRMEIGAVIAAAPAENVRRERPVCGDVDVYKRQASRQPRLRNLCVFVMQNALRDRQRSAEILHSGFEEMHIVFAVHVSVVSGSASLDVTPVSYTHLSDIVPLSDNEALIVYTDFFVPDENGIKRKSLMVIKATVTD